MGSCSITTQFDKKIIVLHLDPVNVCSKTFNDWYSSDAEKSAVDELSDKKSRSAIPANATSRMTRSRMQLKDPLDMSNLQYLEALKSRQKTAEGMDYLADNIVSTKLKYVNHKYIYKS